MKEYEDLYRQFRRFLQKDLDLYRRNRYRNGCRQTGTCVECGEKVYSKVENAWAVCKCGNLSMKENGFFYIVECKKNIDNSVNVRYNKEELGRTGDC